MRERLISGQTWFVEDRTIRLDLVVDVWKGAREWSEVMIDGHWHNEFDVQKIVAGCHNDVYEAVREIPFDRLSSDISHLQKIIVHYLEKFQPHEREHKEVLDAVASKVSWNLIEEGCTYRGDGGVFLHDDLVVFVGKLVEITADTFKRFHVR